MSVYDPLTSYDLQRVLVCCSVCNDKFWQSNSLAAKFPLSAEQKSKAGLVMNKCAGSLPVATCNHCDNMISSGGVAKKSKPAPPSSRL